MNIKLYQEKLIESVIASIEEHGGKELLSSIILTGSFGRNEPTFSYDLSGEKVLKSDVEIALVFLPKTSKDAINKLIKNVSSEFKEELNLMPITQKRMERVYNFNFSFLTPKYKTIFTYDLFSGSRTIWGIDFIDNHKVNINDIDVYEAKRLIGNRIGELVYLCENTDNGKLGELRAQWKGKLILAIVSAWLICERKYVSSYHGQYELVKSNRKNIEKILGEEFFAEYSKVFEYLRENGDIYEASDELMVNFIKKIDIYLRLRNISKPRVNSMSRYIKYLIKYCKTNRRYGFYGFENNILQSLITHYWLQEEEELKSDASVWYNVLY